MPGLLRESGTFQTLVLAIEGAQAVRVVNVSQAGGLPVHRVPDDMAVFVAR